jgi:predicted TIM-barrel fold metal-dependent hydrolase
MIIDAHSHVLAFSNLVIKGCTTPLMSVQEQIAMMDAKGIDKAVILQLHSLQGFGEVLHICEQYPDRFIPFCNLDPRLDQRLDQSTVEDYVYILQQYKQQGAKGVGELITRIFWNDPAMLMMLQACEILGLPVTFHTIAPEVETYGVLDYPDLPLLEEVLKRFSNLTFFGHSQGFWGHISDEPFRQIIDPYPETLVKPTGRVVELLRNYPNLYGDLSAGSGLNALRRDPDFAWIFIEEFQDRLVLGLDCCSVNEDMQHVEWLTQARDNGNISPEIFEKIVWKNINQLLQLNL